MRDYLKNMLLLAAGLASGAGVDAVTLTTTIPVCYPSNSPGGSVSVTTYETTLPDGMVSTVTSSTTLPRTPQGSTSLTTYVTTGAGGVVTTVTSSSVIPPVSVTTFATTLPNGVVSTVTSSSTLPVQTPTTSSMSATTFTTTGPNGTPTVVTSSTMVPVNPPPPPPTPTTSQVIYTTTNPAGSVVVTSRATVVTPTTTPATPATTASGPFTSAVCGSNYRDNNGRVYHIDCGYAYPGYDLPSINVASRDACMEACDTYVPTANVAGGRPCIAWTYGIRDFGGVCYRKYDYVETDIRRGVDSGYLVGTNHAPPQPFTSASVAAPTSTVSAELAFQPCPQSDRQTYIDTSGVVNNVYCSTDFRYNDITTYRFEEFEDCIHACDIYVPQPNLAGGKPCVAASWGYGNPGNNCYLKSAVTEIVYGSTRFCSITLRSYTIPGGIDPPPAVSSSAQGGATTRPSVPVNSPATQAPPPVNSPATQAPPPVNSPATQPPVAGTTTRAPVPGTTTSPGVSPVSSTPAQISGDATCPPNRGDIYTDKFGIQYEIHCGEQIQGENAPQAIHADNFEACVTYCDTLTGCVAVTYPGSSQTPLERANCYPYVVFQAYTQTGNINGLLSARPIRGASTGSPTNQDLCAQGRDGQTFVDQSQKSYTIGCNKSLGTTTGLVPGLLPTLNACLLYCSLYRTCIGVTFTGFIARDRNPNCYPLTQGGAFVTATGTQAALLVT
ncbi:MAG: hypothetical protein Q9174_005716 [Haloplaca sp. 1 TL-2023]